MITTAYEPPSPGGSTQAGIAQLSRPNEDQRLPLFGPRAWVLLLSVFGLGLRLIIVRGFWLDEATTGSDARLSYTHMLQQLTYDNHPPLDYIITWGVAHTIGSTQTDLRLPSILFGTLTIPMVYVAGRALYNERAAVLAAAFCSVGALSVWYSQEARMYSLFMLLATVTIWAQARVITSGEIRYWFAWTLAAVAMIWTQWFASLAVGTELLYFALALSRSSRAQPLRQQMARLLCATVTVVLLCAPGLPLLMTQYRHNESNGLGFQTAASAGSSANWSPYGIINNLVWTIWGYHSNGIIAGAVAIWPLGILGILVMLGRPKTPANRQLAILAVVPMLIIFAASYKAAPNRSLLEVRYFIEAVPAVYLLLAGLAYNALSNTTARRVVIGLLSASMIISLVMQQFDSHNPRLYGYDAAFKQITSIARRGDEILYSPSYFSIDVGYFAPRMSAAPVAGPLPRIAVGAQVFVVGSFDFAGTGVANAQTHQLVARLERTRRLREIFEAPNIVVWEFS